MQSKTLEYEYVIVGGGTGGISVLARLLKKVSARDILIIEPSDKHYYQPMWTLVGAGAYEKEKTARDTRDFIPESVQWLKEFVSDFSPQNNELKTQEGTQVKYKYLILAPGLVNHWEKIKGLKENIGSKGICSNYAYEYTEYTFECLKNTKAGRMLFTMPEMPIKCPGAPQKIMWLADDYLRRHHLRDKVEVVYAAWTPGIFGIPRYKKPLEKLVQERDIHTHFEHNLVEIKADEKIAVFKDLKTDQLVEMSYDMIHVTPPMSAPDFIRDSELADDSGYIEVDKHSLQHKRFPNVWALGDATNTPNSKTGAAIRKQAPILVENLMQFIKGQDCSANYNGYCSCPLVTGYNKAILAEFGYDGEIMESFPFDQDKEMKSMFMLKRYVLPTLYWDFMLKGRA